MQKMIAVTLALSAVLLQLMHGAGGAKIAGNHNQTLLRV